MSTEEFRMALTFAATLVAMGAGTKIILAWLRRPRSLSALPADLAERLERIELRGDGAFPMATGARRAAIGEDVRPPDALRGGGGKST